MSLKERYQQLADRERKLLNAFGAVLGVLVLLLVPITVGMSVSDQKDKNQAYRDAITAIMDARLSLSRRQEETERIAHRYGQPAPALAGYLANAADKTGVEIPETQDRSSVPHGKLITERQTRIRLNKVGLLALTNFLERVTQSGYAVQVSHLDIQKRAKDDEYDVDIDVSAYDREEVKKPVKAAPAAGADAADEAGDDAEEEP